MLVNMVDKTIVSEKAARVASVAGHVSMLVGVSEVVSLLTPCIRKLRGQRHHRHQSRGLG